MHGTEYYNGVHACTMKCLITTRPTGGASSQAVTKSSNDILPDIERVFKNVLLNTLYSM